ncbi:MAG: hypothetical protein IT374_07260 [Polyangiaceae bacterium]|nr:hypothetical protein [Polyangiaceae bacterium]
MTRRALSVCLPVVALAVLVALPLDAARRRTARSWALTRAMGGVVPSPDLAVSPGARHLRHPSSEEPWAAFTDGPATRDAAPSGGMLAAPAAAYREHAARSAR